MVEGKVDEPFGETVAAWSADMSAGQDQASRVALRDAAPRLRDLGEVRYQLLHRTASAVVAAHRFVAPTALVLVHSFSPSAASLGDFQRFLGLYQLQGSLGGITGPVTLDGVETYFGWVQEP